MEGQPAGTHHVLGRVLNEVLMKHPGGDVKEALDHEAGVPRGIRVGDDKLTRFVWAFVDLYLQVPGWGFLSILCHRGGRICGFKIGKTGGKVQIY